MTTINDPGRTQADAPPSEGAELDAFISYARLDLELDRVDGTGFIERLLRDLAAAGKNVWIDRSEIEPAAEWRARIARGIEAAKAVLFVVTPRSAGSTECARELDDAVRHHKRIIPLILRAVPDEEMPDVLRELNWIYARPEDDYQLAFAQLIEALESDLEWRDTHARLATRTREWIDHGRDRSYLLRGSDLKAAEDWYGEKGQHAEQPTDEQYGYIVASRRAASGRLRVILAGVSVALAVAVALAIVALIQRNTAVREQRAAASSSLSAQSSADLATNFDTGGLESLESYRIDPTVAARNSVVTALEQPTAAILRGHAGQVNAVAFSPDGTLLASAGEDGTLRLWNVAARREIGAPINLIGATPGYQTGNRKSSGQATSVSFSPRGEWLAAASVISQYSPGGVAAGPQNSTLTIWSTAGGLRKVSTFSDGGRAITGLAFSPDGNLLAVSSNDGSVVVVSLSLRRAVAEPVPSGAIPSPSGVAVSPDGELAVISGQSIRFWNPATGASTGPRIAFPARAMAFDPRNPRVLAAVGSPSGFPGELTLFNATTGRPLTSFTVSLTAGTNALAFSPDGGMVAVAIGDATPTILVDVGAGLTLGPVDSVSGASDTVWGVAFNPASSEVATANDDGTVRIFTVPGLSGLAHELAGSKIGSEAAVAGSTVAAVNNGVGNQPGAIRFWNLRTGGYRQLPLPGGFTSSLALSPDARLMALGDIDGSVRLASAPSGQPVGTSIGKVGGAMNGQLAFSPHGRLLATAGAGSAHVVNVATGRPVGAPLPAAKLVAAVDTTGNSTYSVGFSRDGSLLAVGDEAGQIRVWNLAGDRLVESLMTGAGPIERVVFAPRSNLLAAIADGQVELWSLASHRRLAMLTTAPNLGSGGLAFSSDGSTLAAVVGCQLDLWDPLTQTAVGPPIDLHYVSALAQGSSAACDPSGDVAFGADGSLVVNLGPAGPIYVWSPVLTSTSAPRFTHEICAVVDRSSLSRAQFAAEVPGQPYHATCAGP
jgi:WD40 repeat protein